MHYGLLKEHFLRHVAFTPQELDTIADYYEERKVAKGAHVLRGGEICEFEGYVVEGCFRIYVIDAKGDEKVLYFAGPDWWVMEIESFANQIPSELYIQAIEDSILLAISWKDKERLYRELPKVERLFRIMSQKAVAAWQRRLVRNHTMNAEERYTHFMNTYPEISSLLTNKLIASYLGITQEFLSMIRRRRAEKKS